MSEDGDTSPREGQLRVAPPFKGDAGRMANSGQWRPGADTETAVGNVLRRDMEYILGFSSDLMGIQIIFPQKLLVDCVQLTPESPVVEIAQKRLKLEEFTPPGGEICGFGGNLTLEVEKAIPDTYTYTAAFPERLMETCYACDGVGKRRFADQDERCFICDGTGEAWVPRRREARALCASLSTLFAWLGYRIEASVMEFISMAGIGQNSASLQVRLNESFCDWLTAISAEKHVEFGYVNISMMKAYQWMSPYSRYDMEKIEARAFEGRLSVECPGDRSGLYASGLKDELISHNLDTAVQQLTLLAGLAKLQDEYRRQ